MRRSPDLVALQDAIRRDFPLDVSRARPLRRHQHVNHVYPGLLRGREVVVRATSGCNTYPVEAWAYRT